MDLITDNYIRDDAAKLLSDALKTNTTLTSLNLSGEVEKWKKRGKKDTLVGETGNKIGDEGATALSEISKMKAVLREVDLSGKKDRKE